MGVSGSGKTTVGRQLARELAWQFADADDYHSPANVEKMRAGMPLTDADRKPWLEQLRTLIAGWIAEGKNAVLACSALRQVYRERLSVDKQVKFVYLKAARDVLSQRLQLRRGHYMKEAMLTSQLRTLEEPIDSTIVNANESPAKIVREIRANLKLT
jgi:gluconokinase